MPSINQVHREWEPKGVTVVLVNIREDRQKVARTIAERGYTAPAVLDRSGEVTEAYGVWVEKSMYGKKYMGIERATFLIDAKGVIREVRHKVKVDGHADEVLKAAEGLR